MAKIKLNLAALSVDDKIPFGNNIKTNITTNVAVFATPNPTMTAYGTVITTLTTKNATVVSLRSQLVAAMNDRDVAEKAFDASTTQLAAYVENIANGDPVKIAQAGMSVKAASAPLGVPSQVQNLTLTAGDNAGEVDLQWDPNGSRNFEIQSSADPVTATSWVNQPSTTKSKTTLAGFTSGSRIWVRVRATGAGGKGPWSDPATKIVP